MIIWYDLTGQLKDESLTITNIEQAQSLNVLLMFKRNEYQNHITELIYLQLH